MESQKAVIRSPCAWSFAFVRRRRSAGTMQPEWRARHAGKGQRGRRDSRERATASSFAKGTKKPRTMPGLLSIRLAEINTKRRTTPVEAVDQRSADVCTMGLKVTAKPFKSAAGCSRESDAIIMAARSSVFWHPSSHIGAEDVACFNAALSMERRHR